MVALSLSASGSNENEEVSKRGRNQGRPSNPSLNFFSSDGHHTELAVGEWNRPNRGGTIEEQLAFAHVARERRSALELQSRLLEAAKLLEEIAAHA
jgi:hypothetical protein